MNIEVDSTSLYFFSAWLQANAAVVAIMGVFVVFHLQSLQQAVTSIKDVLLADRGVKSHPHQILHFAKIPLSEKKSYIQTHAPQEIRNELEEWLELEKAVALARSSLTAPTLLVVGAMGLDSLGIVMAATLSGYGRCIELVVLIIMTCVQIGVLIFVLHRIRNLLDGS